MTESEGREIALVPKWGEPRSEWSQDRPNTLTNAFGVLNAEGQTIKGLHVELEVFVSPRLGQEKYVLSLKRFEFGRVERVYQLEINPRKGLHRNDHAYSHEHFGEARIKADDGWARLSFEDAVKRFCANANVTFAEALPHYRGFDLK